MYASLIRRVASSGAATVARSAAAGPSAPRAAPLSPNDPKVYAVTYVPPLQQTRLTFKRADRGLFDGKLRMSGNNVSEYENRTRRNWLPNVQKVKLYSEALDQRIQLKATVGALRKIEVVGGLDRYLLTSTPKKLGGLGLRLRSLVIAAIRARALLSDGFSTPIDPSQAWQIPQYHSPAERLLVEERGMKPVRTLGGEEETVDVVETTRTRMVQDRYARGVKVMLVREGEEPQVDQTSDGRQPDRRSTHPRRRLQ